MSRGVGILESGVSQRHVGGILDVSHVVGISGMWNRHLTHGDHSQRHGGGRDRAITQHQDHLSRGMRFPTI